MFRGDSEKFTAEYVLSRIESVAGFPVTVQRRDVSGSMVLLRLSWSGHIVGTWNATRAHDYLQYEHLDAYESYIEEVANNVRNKIHEILPSRY